VSTTAAAAGLAPAQDYALEDLWNHTSAESAGTLAAVVPAHGVTLYRVTPLKRVSTGLPPSSTVVLGGLDGPTQTSPATVTETFTDYGASPVKNVRLELTADDGTDITPAAPARFGTVPSAGSVQYPFTVTVPAGSGAFDTAAVTGTVTYESRSGTTAQVSASGTVSVGKAVAAPYRTFASTPAGFGQSGTELGIRAQGSDVYGGTNEYGAVYVPGAEHDGSTTVVKVTSQTDTDPWAKAGIMVRNNITDAGGSTGFLILAVTPGNGYALQWDSDGNGQLDSNQSHGTVSFPAWLKLVRSGTTYTGSWSADGTTWNQIGSVTVPGAAATQDVGVFATAHSGGSTGEADFDGFTTS
jgi:hypothetical protein